MPGLQLVLIPTPLLLVPMAMHLLLVPKLIHLLLGQVMPMSMPMVPLQTRMVPLGVIETDPDVYSHSLLQLPS